MSQQIEDTLLMKEYENERDLYEDVKQSTKDLPELNLSKFSKND